MERKRRTYSAALKAKVALAAVKEDKTLAQLASKYGVHANQISKWKTQLLAQAPELFEHGNGRSKQDAKADESELYEQIGRLKMEIDWLKKKGDEFD